MTTRQPPFTIPIPHALRQQYGQATGYSVVERDFFARVRSSADEDASARTLDAYCHKHISERSARRCSAPGQVFKFLSGSNDMPHLRRWRE